MTSFEPIGPSELPPGVTYEQATQAARDAAMVIEASENVKTLVTQLQAQIDQLTATTQAQTTEIARMNAAMRALPCPEEHHIGELLKDASTQQFETIGECVTNGLCSCEVGYILTAETWAPS
jgi:hypothetical protein